MTAPRVPIRTRAFRSGLPGGRRPPDPVPGLGREARPGDAPGAPRRREAVRRLRRADGAVLGASSYTFAEATWTQTLPDWTASHVRAFEFYGGCPEMVVPDNLRSGVSRAHRYEPDLNPTYHDLARHYGVAVLPARVRRPRDKAKAEVAVQVVERWIPRRPAPPHVLLAGRAQRRDRRAARTAQHAAVPQAPGVAALAVRAARPSGTSVDPQNRPLVDGLKTGHFR